MFSQESFSRNKIDLGRTRESRDKYVVAVESHIGVSHWLPMDKQRAECHFNFDRYQQSDEHQDRRRHRARSSGMAQIINCIYKAQPRTTACPIKFAVGPRRFLATFFYRSFCRSTRFSLDLHGFENLSPPHFSLPPKAPISGYNFFFLFFF